MPSFEGTEWTLGKSLAGGAIISASTVLMMLLKGKLAGLSSIFSGLFYPGEDDWAWKSAFTSGFIGGVSVLNALYPELYILNSGGHSVFQYCVGGFLVGFGARFGSGCTSGHGICGLSRFSRRSVAAVLIFMTSAALVSTSLELNGALLQVSTSADRPDGSSRFVISSLAILLGCFSLMDSRKRNNNMKEYIVAAPLGALFSAGLTLSGMVNPRKVLSFLVLNANSWDPSLAFVMMGAIPLTAMGFKYVVNRGKPLLAHRVCMPTVTTIDLPLVIGSWLFGVGWGIVGLCPGPSVALASAGVRNIWMYHVPSMTSGMIIAQHVLKLIQK